MPGNTVIGRHVVLVGQDYIAHELGVGSPAVSMWYLREKRDMEAGLPSWGMPKAAPVLYAPGKKPSRVWRESQIPAWRRWYAKRHPEAAGQAEPAKAREAA
jgi:hypothetical protein